MASTDSWSDFEATRHSIKHNTVDKLKQILSGFNEECGTHHTRSGKKQEIIDRIISSLDQWRATNAEDKWLKAKAVVAQVRTLGAYTPSYSMNSSSSSTSNVHSNSFYHANSLPKPPFSTTASRPSNLPLYDPYAPPRRPNVPPGPSSTSFPRPPTSIRFKDSPFYQIEQQVSAIVECPESVSSADRRQQTVTFILNNEHISKLRTSGSKYQLRLFCTSSFFYSGHSSFRSSSTSSVPCLVEFPPTCEVRVNNVQLNANLKGLKKKPGTAPPPDITRLARITNSQNRIEMVYINSTQPVQNKKYYLVVMLVEITSVDQLVERLKATSYQSSEDIKQKMVESASIDDDIVAGPSKMSLKCPLSFLRVNTPCRSSKCVHSQCFDATSWYSMMEQTSTWLCPVCEKHLDYKELIVDGYFDSILKTVPDSIEDVIVEANGEWHTADNRYGSAEWKADHPPIIKSPSPKKEKTPPPIKTEPDSGKTNGKQKTDVAYILLDSDDEEDEGQVKKELSPSRSVNRSLSSIPPPLTPQASQRTQDRSRDVIDLTLESDEEGSPPSIQQPTKRKAGEADLGPRSPTEPIWKKGRHDDYHLPSISTLPNAAPTVPFRPSSLTNSNRLPPPHPMSPGASTRYPPYPGHPPASHYNSLPIRGNGSPPGSLQLPPLSSLHPPPRQNGNGRWP